MIRILPWPAPALVVVALGADTNGNGPTKLLRSPTVCAAHVAFAYANNIWVSERSGGLARRVTSFQIPGKDPQLERAVEKAIELLKTNPPRRMTTEPPPPTWGKGREVDRNVVRGW